MYFDIITYIYSNVLLLIYNIVIHTLHIFSKQLKIILINKKYYYISIIIWDSKVINITF